MTDHKNRQMQMLERENDRLIDVIMYVLFVFGGFAVGVYSFFEGWL
jgi:hypothetical protein